jgi:SAM-dependent methyltransferase
MSAKFDRYQSTYSDAVNRSISFAGAHVDFFTQLKADDIAALVRRRLGRKDEVSALDFGCGSGLTDALVAPRVGRLTGVDVSAALIESARTANPGVDYIHYDRERLPFEDGTFDLAFAICVFHHIDPPDRAAVTAELARVLRPGGLVAIYEHNPLNPLTRLAVSRCEFDDGVELLPRSETKGMLRAAGLAPVEWRYVAFFPWRGRAFRAVERVLARLPFGAQYVVAAVRDGDA